MRALLIGCSVWALSFSSSCQNEEFVTHGDGGGSTTEAGNQDARSTRPQCPGQESTIQGTVLAPNGLDPVPNAAVFIPAEALTDFPTTVQCEVCSQPGSTTSEWYVTSSFDGTFVLTNVCPGSRTVVLQNGRFRRVLELEVPSGQTMSLSAEQTRLPRRDKELNAFDAIPRIAVATGDYDQMECVLRKIGLEDTAFDLYEDAANLVSPAGLTPFSSLVGDLQQLQQYNIVFINCTENTYENELQKANIRQNLNSYIQAGGRLYVTDWSYDWIEQVESLSPFIDFEPSSSDTNPEPVNAAALGQGGNGVAAVIKAPELAQWLGLFPEAIQNGVTTVDHFLDEWVMMYGVNQEVKVWVEGDVRSFDGSIKGVKPLTVSFNFQSCGKILFTSYHTEGREDAFFPKAFPQYCDLTSSPQDRILEYLIFDIANCVGPIE